METAQKYLQDPKGRTKKTTILSSKQRLNQESSLGQECVMKQDNL